MYHNKIVTLWVHFRFRTRNLYPLNCDLRIRSWINTLFEETLTQLRNTWLMFPPVKIMVKIFSYLHFTLMKFDRFFTFVHEVYLVPCPSIKFDLNFTLVQNPACRLFLWRKMTCATNVTWRLEWHMAFSVEKPDSRLGFGLKWKYEQTLRMGMMQNERHGRKCKSGQTIRDKL